MAIDRKPDSLEVPRAIEFYHVVQRSADHTAVDVKKLLTDMHNVPLAERPVRIKSNNEEFMYWVTFSETTDLIGLAIGITRSKAQSGKVSKQDYEWRDLGIKPDEEQTEVSHLVVFPNNIVAFEHNQHGPRLSQLTNYLFNKLQSHGSVAFEHCARPTVKEKEQKWSHVAKARFVVTPETLEIYGHLLGSDFEESRRKDLQTSGADSVVIEYKINAKMKVHGDIGGVVQKFTNGLWKQDKPEKVLEKTKAKFHARNERAMNRSLVNLLSDKIEDDALFALISQSDRRVNSLAAFETLRKAYDDNKRDLETSVAFRLFDEDLDLTEEIESIAMSEAQPLALTLEDVW